MDFVGQDRRSVFEPDRVVLHRPIGTVVEARDDPERSFDGHQFETPWDDLHLAYFTGEALWTYLNTPFLFTWPGFVCEEIAPIEADGETWRRLKVTFPDHIKSHTRTQVFCFGPDGLLRRHDFTIDIVGRTVEAQLYAADYRDVDGIVQIAHLAHLHVRDTTLAFASRAPQPDIERMKALMGWAMPWYTITDSFDADFGVAEWYGTNAFIRDRDNVYRTYFINDREHEPMGAGFLRLHRTREATRRIRLDRASRAPRHHRIGGSCTP